MSAAPGVPAPTQQFRNMPAKQRRRYLVGTVVRAVVSTALVLGLYFVLPFDEFATSNFWVTLSLSLVIVAVLIVMQVRAVLRAARPGQRAVQAVAVVIPAFVAVFAIAYFMLSRVGTNFNDPDLTKVDSLYFTMTVLTTVGFGDIVATSQSARVVVMVQEALDLIVIGLVIRVFVAAVQEAWKRHDGTGPLLRGADEPDDDGSADAAPPAPSPRDDA